MSISPPPADKVTDPGRGGHYIVWTITPEIVSGSLLCDAGPEGWCHLVCAEGCEEFDLTGEHEHSLKPDDECQVELWINADSPELTYDGFAHRADSGPVEVMWRHGYYAWRYPSGASDETGAGQ